MPRLTIDKREVEVPDGATILDAAANLGIEIPTLCFLPGCEPSTSCLVCLVKIGDGHRLVPACATAASEGLVVESESEEVRLARRAALELLLSDHLGDCLAPCSYGCPAGMNIPQMLRQVAEGDFRGAVATVKADIALPAVLGRVCPAPCEKVCRRGGLDGAVTICGLERLVGDVDLAADEPYRPPCAASSGKRVVVAGGGPTGLAAAYYLARHGHACTLLDDNAALGGRLHQETSEEVLSRSVLAAEIAQITRLGIEVRLAARLGRDVSLAELLGSFDAVLVACGGSAAQQAAAWGLATGPNGILERIRSNSSGKNAFETVEIRRQERHTPVRHAPADRRTFQTGLVGVFAAGGAIRGGKGMIARSVADGREAARAIDQFLAGGLAGGAAQPFNVRTGRMDRGELLDMAGATADVARSAEASGPEGPAAAQQARRCLHCDCRAAASCKLRKYAAEYGADPRRYKGSRRVFQQDARHAEVVFEPGKCIACGLCIQISAAAGEPLGMTFLGRGFDVRVGVPLGHTLAEALTNSAAACVAACPTAALAWKRDAGR
jgi:NADPH-dependent glutamate synthase beta subunit-like oxidoreductase